MGRLAEMATPTNKLKKKKKMKKVPGLDRYLEEMSDEDSHETTDDERSESDLADETSAQKRKGRKDQQRSIRGGRQGKVRQNEGETLKSAAIRGEETAQQSNEEQVGAFVSFCRETGSMSSVSQEQIAVNNCIGELFRKKKFFSTEEELKGNGKVANFFYDRMRISGERQGRWWDTVKDYVRKTVGEKRATISNGIKMEFMRKYSRV